MTFVLKVLKCISGLCSGALSLLFIFYLGIKNEAWEILASDGQVIVDKTAGICLALVWAAVGALFLLFEFLYKRASKQTDVKEER